MKTYICVISESGAGKGTVLDLISKELSSSKTISIHRFSDVLNEMLALFGIPNERKNQIALSTALRKTFGEDTLQKPLMERVEKDPADIVLIDGARRMEDISLVLSLPNWHFVFITADDKTRFERIKKRADRPGDDTMTWEQFVIEQNSETETRIAAMKNITRNIIDNSGSLEDLTLQIKNFIQAELKI